MKEAFIKISKYLRVTGLETTSRPDLERTVISQQKEIEALHDSLDDFKQRLSILTRETLRMRVCYRYMGDKPPYRRLSDEECDRIIVEDENFRQELRSLGYSTTIEELKKKGITIRKS